MGNYENKLNVFIFLYIINFTFIYKILLVRIIHFKTEIIRLFYEFDDISVLYNK